MQASSAPAQVRINHSKKHTSCLSSYLFRTVAPASFQPIRGEDHGFSHQTGKSSGKLSKPDELLQMPGRGPLDFGPIVKALKQTGYRGFVSIFMHPYPRGIPILPTVGKVPVENNRARRHLESLA